MEGVDVMTKRWIVMATVVSFGSAGLGGSDARSQTAGGGGEPMPVGVSRGAAQALPSPPLPDRSLSRPKGEGDANVLRTGHAAAAQAYATPQGAGPVPVGTYTYPSPQSGVPAFPAPQSQAGPVEGFGGAGMGPGVNPPTPGANPSMPGGFDPNAGAGAGAAGAGAGAGASAPGAAPTSAAAAAAAAATATAADFASTSAANAPGFGGGLASGGDTMPMIGDQSSFRSRASATGPGGPVNPPPLPNPRASSLFFPGVRTFKVTENMSPRPQDRFFVNFNYFTKVNETVNRAEQVPISNMTAYRWVFGFEKTFDEGKGSVGIRLPLNTLTANGTRPDVSTPTTTALGNLTVFSKYVLKEDKATGSLFSVGLAITPPTGPSRFASSPYVFHLNTTTIQPFIGWIVRRDRFYLQGFSAFDFPANPREVTLMYNDVAVGYYLIKADQNDRFLTALAPTFEVHVNSPFNHRGALNRFDPAGTADVVNLTYGIAAEFRRSSVLTVGLVTPVSSPKPFNAELAVLYNIYFGRSRGSRLPVTPPPVL